MRRSHKHQIQKYGNKTVCDGCTERKIVLSFVILFFVYDVSASVNELQIVFSNSPYENNANGRLNRFLERV